jgi:cobalt/nickel transport system permease protein
MHISEGILSGPVLIGGWALSSGGLALGLKGLKEKQIPKAAVLASAFFVASLVHVPVGPSSAHLLLIGLVGILLGWACFPVIFVGLLLQAILFQYGGVVVLGVNTFIMAFPGVIVYLFLGKPVRSSVAWIRRLSGFFSGFLGIFFSALFCSLALVFTEKNLLATARLIVLAHVPVMLLEGLVNAIILEYLNKVSPAIIQGLEEE